jgi:hypothetical protein
MHDQKTVTQMLTVSLESFELAVNITVTLKVKLCLYNQM